MKKIPIMQISLDQSPEALSDLLSLLNWLQPGEEVQRLEKPGEGNMNVVMRVKTNQRSFILKQSRPYVEKYQQVAAPIDRIITEKKFYDAIDDDAELMKYSPLFLKFEPDHHLALIEDLGKGQDFSSLYNSEKGLSEVQLKSLVHYLKVLHQKEINIDFPDNLELRKINYQHIFHLPFLENNGFDLGQITPGLVAVAQPIKKDQTILSIVKQVGDKYLATDGDTLVHGDYYPGSWLSIGNEVKVIDPEFSFLGFAEFDLGVMVGHLVMSSGQEAILQTIVDHYDQSTPDLTLIRRIAGIEIIRRLIGLAQLPLDRTLAQKEILLKIAVNFIKHE